MNIEEILHNELTEDQYNTVIESIMPCLRRFR